MGRRDERGAGGMYHIGIDESHDGNESEDDGFELHFLFGGFRG